MLSLGIVVKVLVLPQRNVLYFVDSPWEVLSSLRSGCSIGWGETGESGRREGSVNWD